MLILDGVHISQFIFLDIPIKKYIILLACYYKTSIKVRII